MTITGISCTLAFAAALLGSLPASAQQRAFTLPPGVAVERDLVYATPPDQSLMLDLYRPESPNGLLPVVVWIHGGAWRAGSRNNPPAARLAARGYAVASISYRLSGVAKFPAQVHDCKAAVRWLRANAARYGLDPSRIGAWGSSAGGHLVAMLGTTGGVSGLEGDLGNNDQSSRVQAVVDFFGPSDLPSMDAQGASFSHLAADSPESQLIGATVQDNLDKARQASPLTYVSKDDSPFLLMHGDKDFTVPLGQSRLLYDALRKAGVEARLEVVRDAGHGFSGGPYIDAAVDDFLDRHLKTARPARPARDWVDLNRAVPPRTQLFTFFSRHAKQPVSYVIYLPPDYDTEDRRYPVIYWLHGWTGNQRVGARDMLPLFDAAVRAKTAPPAIVVFPNGLWDSFYCDSASGTWPVESVIIQDLIPHIDSTYRTIPTRAARAVEGYSMGGFGAAHLGFKYPELFSAVSVMAGALLDPGDMLSRHPDISAAFFASDRARYEAETPAALAAKNLAAIKDRVAVRIIVGDQDPLLPRNRILDDTLNKLAIRHEFALVPGVAHNGMKFYEVLGARGPAFYAAAFRDLK